MKVLYFSLWALFLVTTPLYLLPSGGPQLAHIPLALIFSVLFFKSSAAVFGNTPTKIFGGFAFYALCVNLCYWFFSNLQDYIFLLSSLYLLFNVVTFVVTYAMAKRENGFSLIYYSLTVVAVVQVCAFFVLGMNFGGVRYLAFFNDPNQLSSWALFSTVVFAAMKQSGKISVVKFLVGGIACAALVLLSVSRGGTIALACIWIVVFWKSPIWVKLILGCIFLISATVFLPYVEEMPFFSRIQTLSEISIGEDRHWSRVWEFPLYNILGAGAGGYGRFDFTGMEIHSTLLTVLFSYGIPGILLYFTFIKACVFKTLKNNFILIFLPLLPTFVSVNMVRMTSLYVMFGVLFTLMETKSEKERGRSRHLRDFHVHRKEIVGNV